MWSGPGAGCASSSEDYGRTWSPALPTAIPHRNSGLDAVRLADGRIVLAGNPVREGRTPLALLVSAGTDTALVLDAGELPQRTARLTFDGARP